MIRSISARPPNTFARLAFGTDFEHVSGAGTVQDYVFNAYGAEESIAFGYLSLTALPAATALGVVLGPITAVAAIGGAAATDVVRRTPNTVEVTRTIDGAIRITDTNWLQSGTIVVNPVGTLTVNTGLSYMWDGDSVVIDDLGSVNFGLTVNSGRLNTNESSPGEVIFRGASSFDGRDLTVNAETITLETGASVATGSATGAAGDIAFNAISITLEQNAGFWLRARRPA
jgi:hypothetical protein